jgi:rod shape determining protein RodA
MLRFCYIGYYILIAVLAFTLVKGSIGMGAQRWIDVGLFKLQPSELAKIFFPAYAVYTLYLHQLYPPLPQTVFIPVLSMLFAGTILIRQQPDLGTAVVIGCSGLLLCWLAGISHRFFIACTFIGLLSLPLLQNLLKPYQLQRISVFLGYGETNKERYQIEQAGIAIGSGGIYGKGLLEGTQNKLHFLPEGRTDFIFAVLCEEWGLIGALFVLFLYGTLFVRSFNIIRELHDFYSQLLAAGLITPIVLATLINIGMVLGLLPIVGIPLPLMSYGISNLWVTMIALGWFQSIARQRMYQNNTI